jgi:hypothetical protein
LQWRFVSARDIQRVKGTRNYNHSANRVPQLLCFDSSLCRGGRLFRPGAKAPSQLGAGQMWQWLCKSRRVQEKWLKEEFASASQHPVSLCLVSANSKGHLLWLSLYYFGRSVGIVVIKAPIPPFALLIFGDPLKQMHSTKIRP